MKDTSPVWFVAGDVILYGVVAVIGFSSHGRLGTMEFSRFLATWIPFSAAWVLVAGWAGLFRRELVLSRRGPLQAALAAGISAPLGGMLRGMWLGAAVLPVFVLVMAGVSALGMLVWRGSLRWWLGRK